MSEVEPLLDLEDIQGNIYPGFNKDHQTFIFLEIVDVGAAKSALRDLTADVASSQVVQDYARLRAAIKKQRGGGPSGLTATWMNISLGYNGLSKLAPADVAKALGEGALAAGLVARSSLLGDPVDPTAPGHPSHWTIGRPDSASMDIVLTIAGDRREDVDAFRAAIEARLAQHTAADGTPGLRRSTEDLFGDTLGDDLNGHEHFGFKDGVSQPALRGRSKSSPESFVTERTLDPTSPQATRVGRPGQVLLWPGQILLRQLRQSATDPTKPSPAIEVGPVWVTNGSFMVLRVLEQDVPAFWKTMRGYAQTVDGRDDDTTTDWVAARVVGRWRSGAPLERTPDADDPRLVGDNRVSNDFGFRQDTTRPIMAAGQPPLPTLPLAKGDPEGAICPFAAHIRKVNPRDDAVEQGGPNDTLLRLFVRRGIPFGPRFPDPRRAVPDGISRGLIFVSYQASIERQFEFVMQKWVNSNEAPRAASGRDAVLGRHAVQPGTPATTMRVQDQEGEIHILPQVTDFITPKGGGYFFTPSIKALSELTK
ncbi:Dyp-type peroxidase [Mesorhizobium sp. B3-1-3]|uniref:Dyp-type peroxidase n=1 Tax=unclassified Mesorhizobium TaxID=325217 RepID=UPI00112AC55E|nr:MULTISPECIES: Dyp-type peroxidase [unclassified Mesorhizobium]TPI62533.1 Dyp-type peroxidase [Mesorhizobium sp. B3-1-8]TPI74102.1 Dyp-type peroxidase [Mesorhizobium sp. B3-1-3]